MWAVLVQGMHLGLLTVSTPPWKSRRPTRTTYFANKTHGFGWHVKSVKEDRFGKGWQPICIMYLLPAGQRSSGNQAKMHL